MKLVDMQNTKAEIKSEMATEYKPPKYPWGLSVNLDNGSLEKLGMETLPKIGTTMILTARVEVSSLSEYDSQQGGASRSLGLQITDMALAGEGDKGGAAKALYSEEGEG